MISLSNGSAEIQQLKANIEQQLEHTYLDSVLKRPRIDEEKLILLAALTDGTSLSGKQKEHYIMAAMLAQVALDTHDLVPEVNQKENREQRNSKKQLTVLAGDYYSGLYYLLLTKIDDFDFIHILAAAIKEINEYKMRLYYNEARSFDEFIGIAEKVESMLILHVARFLEEPTLNNIIGPWLISQRLIKEKDEVARGEFSPMLAHWQKNNPSYSNEELLQLINQLTAAKKRDIIFALSKLPQRFQPYKQYLSSIMDRNLTHTTPLAEEG